MIAYQRQQGFDLRDCVMKEQQDRIAQLEATQLELVEALEKSRNVFDNYVQLHLDKNPPDGEKAARNAFHRGICQIAIDKVRNQK